MDLFEKVRGSEENCSGSRSLVHFLFAKMNQESHPKKESDARDPTYFQYYAQFVHQANMLQDQVRTSMYYSTIVYNGPTLFQDKIVMDLGAGSGI